MAFLEMHYHSDAIKTGVSVNIILPEKQKSAIGIASNASSSYKTLYLLHGLSDDHTIWMRRTSVERYAAEYGIAVVMPEVGRSWYTDTYYGANYFTFISEELPKVCRSYFKGMSDEPKDNFIAGLSMGGYGALKIALCHPDKFGGCASLSGALDFTYKERPFLNNEIPGIFGSEVKSVADLKGTKHDVFYLAENLHASGASFPKIYLWCGTEDELIDSNREYHKMLDKSGVKHFYEESEGNHSWKWWDLHIQDAIRYLLSDKT